MLEQCIFAHSFDKVGLLKVWPLPVWEVGGKCLATLPFNQAICAVQSVSRNRAVFFPNNKSVPGKTACGGAAKLLTRDEILSYLSQKPKSDPIDLLIFFANKKTLTQADEAILRSQILSIQNQTTNGGDKEAAADLLRRLNGFNIFVHDGDSFSLRVGKIKTAASFYERVVQEMVSDLDRKTVSKAWRLLLSKDQAQIVTGYARTMYIQMVSSKVLGSANVPAVLNWDFFGGNIIKIGEFSPDAAAKFKLSQ